MSQERRANWRVALSFVVGAAGGVGGTLGVQNLIERFQPTKVEQPYARLRAIVPLNFQTTSSTEFNKDLELVLRRFEESRQHITLPNTPDSDLLNRVEARFRIPFGNYPQPGYAEYIITRGNRGGSTVRRVSVVHGYESTGENWSMMEEEFIDNQPTRRTYNQTDWPRIGYWVLAAYNQFSRHQ